MLHATRLAECRLSEFSFLMTQRLESMSRDLAVMDIAREKMAIQEHLMSTAVCLNLTCKSCNVKLDLCSQFSHV